MKIARAARQTGLSRCLVIGFWTVVMSLANESPRRGELYLSEEVPMEIGEVADAAGVSGDEARAMVDAFCDLGMVRFDDQDGICLVNWETRNPDSDNVTMRVQKHRNAKKRNVTETLQVEDVKRSCNVIEESRSREEENRSESEEKRVDADSTSARTPEIQSVSAAEPADEFEKMARQVEQKTGILAGGAEAVDAIADLVKMGATGDDIDAAVTWMAGNKRTIRYMRQLVGPVQTAIAQRVQSKARASPEIQQPVYEPGEKERFQAALEAHRKSKQVAVS